MRYLVFIWVFSAALLGGALKAQAATEPTVSRCNTAAVRKLRDQMIERFQKTTAFVDKTSPEEIKEAYETYANGMDIAWAAITDPYCGYGNNYSGIPTRLYSKTVNRIHESFLQAVKNAKTDQLKEEADETVKEEEMTTSSETAQEKEEDDLQWLGLRYGMRTTEVLELQKSLSKIPKLYPEKLLTGYFGPATQRAVIRFQRQHQLLKQKGEKLGVIGPATLVMLRKELLKD